MALVECDRIHGKTTLHEQDPVCAVFENILYMPAEGEDARNQRSYGLYDRQGRLLEAGGRFRGPVRERAGPMPYTSQRMEGLPLKTGPFFYLGRFTTHYGHFLIDTLCRLWAWPAQGLSGVKILYHDTGPERLFALPFAAEIFRACGLGPENFIRFDEPVRLGQVIVPSPAIEELGFVHRAFARKFNAIGDALCPGPAGPVSDVPVYVTKRQLTSGVSHFVNEERFTEVLARTGVRIVIPEALSFVEQVALFRKNRVISGLIGSAFHTSLFTPACRMLILNFEQTVWSNQLLIDRANGNQAEFVYDPETRQLDGGRGFANNFEMADPVRLAEGFLRRLDGFAKAPRASLAVAVAEVKHNYAICACARWEDRFIVEWLSYYRELGFSHVYLYCNDDDPGELYERVLPFTQGAAPFVTFRHHPHQGQQFEMYVHFVANGLAESEWVAFFDIDEFLRLPPGLDIAGFMRRFIPEVECVMFNWIFFGPNGHKTPPEGKVLENFTRRAAGIHPYTKFVARSRAVAEIDFTNRARAHGFWHEIGSKMPRMMLSANALGEPMMEYYQGFPASSEAFVNEPARRGKMLETAILHHYAFRSEQAYAERAARGLKGDFNGQGIWKDLAEGPGFAGLLAAMNEVEDRSLAGFWQVVRARAGRLGTGLAEYAATPTRPDNISRGKTARQSSHCGFSFAQSLEADAAGGVNGVLDGARKFHTDIEENPWWQVDLGGIATITEIHVINTRDNTRARFRDFALSVSIDGSSWVDVLEKRDGQVVEAPVVWNGPGPAWARFVRVTLLGRDYLHLNQVEVFGRLP